jgi:3'(2'), 5'-bisphosphate nucleotidase
MTLSETYKAAVTQIALDAGDKIMKFYNNERLWDGSQADFINQKDDKSPVTLADKAADDLIVAALSKLTPHIPILSEEGGQELDKFDQAWIVDPLDGTRQFVNRCGHFTVNIALIEHGKPVLGVIYEPVLKKLYVSGQDSTPSLLDESALLQLCHGSLTRRIDLLDSFLEFCCEKEIAVHSFQISSSLKYCYVTDGNAHAAICIHPMSCWDVAAADAIVHGAGGLLGIWQPDTNTLKPIDYAYHLETNAPIPPGALALSRNVRHLL